jgi:hypothetical protein
MTHRERWTILSAVVLTLGGGVLSIFGFVAFLERHYPALMERHHMSIVEIGMLVGSLFVVLIFGLLLGATACIVLWRPFSTQEQLEMDFNRPRMPGISTFLSFVIRALYPR